MQTIGEYHALPGDLIGFETSGLFATAIRFGQRLAKVKHRKITHIAVVERTTSDGDASIIQSVRRVNRVWLSSYGRTPYIVIPFPGKPCDRAAVVAFAQSAEGRKYGVASVISRAINVLTPKFITFSRGGDCDCATLGARAWEHGGWVSPLWDTSQWMPGQLADLKETA